MREEHLRLIASELGLDTRAVGGVLSLLEEGATVPFVARYRKERTGAMDEEMIRAVRDRESTLAALDDRRESILRSLKERDLLTAELETRIGSVATMAELEDLYLPYRPKRKTKASKAREQGLEPLADALLTRRVTRPLQSAQEFINPDLGIETPEDALAGARDIIAETISEDASLRSAL